MLRLISILFFCTAFTSMAIAQGSSEGSVQTKNPEPKVFSGDPGKAALYSLVLPGAGQIYNKKYWKLPLVYGAIGGTIGVIAFNTDQYRTLTDLYEDSLSGDYNGPLSSSQIQSRRQLAKKNQQISIVLLGVAWILNSADAFVDAHLNTFDTSDDLSLVRPCLYQDDLNPINVGIVLAF